MAKNILVITGSARTDGNSMALAKAFIRGARNNGNNVRRFDAALKVIYPCRGCDNCWAKGKPCVVDDAFNQVAPYLHVSNIIVFATPIYWGTFSSATKLFIDKLYAYTLDKRKKDLKVAQSILLAAAEDDKPDTFRMLIENYQFITKNLKWENIGIITAGGFKAEKSIDSSPAIQEAYDLGNSIE